MGLRIVHQILIRVVSVFLGAVWLSRVLIVWRDRNTVADISLPSTPPAAPC